jgi:hypothetical protein
MSGLDDWWNERSLLDLEGEGKVEGRGGEGRGDEMR